MKGKTKQLEDNGFAHKLFVEMNLAPISEVQKLKKEVEQVLM